MSSGCKSLQGQCLKAAQPFENRNSVERNQICTQKMTNNPLKSQ